MTTHSQFTFNFKLLEHGWAEATIHAAGSSVALDASYICEPLGDLAKAITNLCKSSDLEGSCSWLVGDR